MMLVKRRASCFGAVQSKPIGTINGIQVEASPAVAASLDSQLWQLLEVWIRLVMNDILLQAEQYPSGQYTRTTALGEWTVRIVQGRDVARNAYATQVWLRNMGQTRFMGIFASRDGMVYNIDVKQFDARFVWWAIHLTGELEDDA